MNKKTQTKIKNIFSQRLVLKPKKVSKKTYLKLVLIALAAFLITIFIYQRVSLFLLARRFSHELPLSLKYDPMLLYKQIKNNELKISLVDIRSKTEFKNGHIWGAVNISWQNKPADFLKELKKIKLKNNRVVIYQYSSHSVLPEELVVYLRKAGVEAYYLTIGYIEWRNFNTFWLSESELENFQIENYIQPSRQ